MAANMGPGRLCAGWRNKSSLTRRNRSFSRMRLTRSRMPRPVCVASMSKWRQSCQAGQWRRYQAMRGVSFLVAVTFVAEIGDLQRFDNPRQLMAFLGLVPSERSTGERVRRAGLTLAGNKRARRVLVEGAWSYRYRARVSQTLQAR